MSAILQAVLDQLLDNIDALEAQVPGVLFRRESGESKKDFISRLPEDLQEPSEWRDAEGRDAYPRHAAEPADNLVSVKWYPELVGLIRLSARIRTYIQAESKK